MEKRQALCCFFPTTVVLVDDSRKYIMNVLGDLETKSACYRIFDRPQDALKALNEQHPDPFTNRCVQIPD